MNAISPQTSFTSEGVNQTALKDYKTYLKHYSFRNLKPMSFEEFETEQEWWGNEADDFASRIETEQAWKISIEEIIKSNYNLDIKNPHVDEQISHDPEKLLEEYYTQQSSIQSIRDQLKNVLSEALTRGHD